MEAQPLRLPIRLCMGDVEAHVGEFTVPFKLAIKSDDRRIHVSAQIPDVPKQLAILLRAIADRIDPKAGS
jgi:hypothetical protein